MPGDEHSPLLPSDRAHFANQAQAASNSIRRQTKRFLTSKTGHYAVLLLVSLDISAIFADLLLTALACEGHVPKKDANRATKALGIVSLVFSSLFMVELLASIWAFGLHFFHSWFHCLDSFVIIAGFVIDVLLRGTLEEAGSIVVALRLFRVAKIIDELSAGASENMEPLNERIRELEMHNHDLENQIERLKNEHSLGPNGPLQIS